MDGSGACAGIRSQLGVYLTGAIAPADRAAVVRHLVTCVDCRAELAGLAALPALLRRPPARAAAQAPAPDGTGFDGTAEDGAAGRERGEAQLGRLLSTMARRRRRHRWLLAAAALVLAAVAGTGWGLRLAEPQAPATQTAGTVLETLNVGGVTVLTDAEGYT